MRVVVRADPDIYLMPNLDTLPTALDSLLTFHKSSPTV